MTYIVWCAVENCTVIITSSIPFLRPLFRPAPKPYVEVKNIASPVIINQNMIEYMTSKEILAETEARQGETEYMESKGGVFKLETHSLV